MTKRGLLIGALWMLGCSGRVAEKEPEAGVAEGEAVCTTGVRPEAPAEPTSACLEEVIGEGSVVVSTLRRTTSVVDGVDVVREETFDAAGVLTERVVRKTRGALVLFESTEHVLLAKTDSLPYTYGEPATISTTYDYDSAGRLRRKAEDRAMDGVIDTEELTTYHPTGEVAVKTTIAGGKVTRTASFDAAGNPLSELDAGGYGRRWIYEGGLLIREERLEASAVVQRTDWTMRAAKKPLKQVVFDIGKSGVGTKVAEGTWTYAATGVLTSTDGFQIVSGARRVKHAEYDARGRTTLFVEENEEPTCRRYLQVSEYADGDEPVQQTTTCDGRRFENLHTSFDARGKKTRIERGFYGNPTSVSEDVTTFDYDSCGRLVSSESTHNGALQRRERYTFDARGRMTSVEVTDRTGASSTSSIAYDTEGRVVAMDGKRWSYDSAGRVTAVEAEGFVRSGDLYVPVTATRFRYVCTH
jgi:hypothetical protein